MSFITQESYRHKLSKEQLYKWLCSIESGNRQELHEDFKIPFGWNKGNYGVHLELPFYETSSPYYFEQGAGIISPNGLHPSTHHHSNFVDPLVNRGKILFVPDITIFHKGTAYHFIEVCYKNKTSAKKIQDIKNFFGTYPIYVWEIEADNILNQTNIKFKLEFEQLL